MKAVKENKEYTITEQQQDYYLAQGYDITDDKGNIIKRSPKATVSYAEFECVKKELDELKEQQNNPAEEADVVEILKTYANEHEIDLGKSSTVSGIVKKIKDHAPDGSE